MQEYEKKWKNMKKPIYIAIKKLKKVISLDFIKKYIRIAKNRLKSIMRCNGLLLK